MVQFEVCHPKHFEYIAPTLAQTTEYRLLQTSGVAEVFASGIALSAWVSGTCIGAAGVFLHWPGRAEAWMLMGCGAGHHLLPCIRKMRYVLDTLPYKRVDMVVARSNRAGHVIADLLQFKPEAVLEAYHVSGEDVAMYKRIKR